MNFKKLFKVTAVVGAIAGIVAIIHHNRNKIRCTLSGADDFDEDFCCCDECCCDGCCDFDEDIDTDETLKEDFPPKTGTKTDIPK